MAQHDNQGLAERIQRIFLYFHPDPAKIGDPSYQLYLIGAEDKVGAFLQSGLLVQQLEKAHESHPEELKSLEETCKRYEETVSRLQDEVKEGKLEGIIVDGHFYSGQDYVGMPFHKMDRNLFEREDVLKDALPHRHVDRRYMPPLTAFLTLALSAHGVIGGVLGVRAYTSLKRFLKRKCLGKQPDEEEERRLWGTDITPSMLVGFGVYCLTFFGTAAGLQYLAPPWGLAYGLVATGPLAVQLGVEAGKDFIIRHTIRRAEWKEYKAILKQREAIYPLKDIYSDLCNHLLDVSKS